MTIPRPQFAGAAAFVATATALVAFMLSIAGPALDHHYSERVATHGHLYLDAAQTAHGHVMDSPHSHDASSDAGVVNLLDRDAGSTLTTSVGGPDAVAAEAPQTPTLALARYGAASGSTDRPDEAALRPPEKPPQA